MPRRSAGSPLFPYTTLFRSRHRGEREFPRLARRARVARRLREELAVTPPLTPSGLYRLEQLRNAQGGEAAGSLAPSTRSEEHTSELQSHSDLVCRLLLEKKK